VAESPAPQHPIVAGATAPLKDTHQTPEERDFAHQSRDDAPINPRQLGRGPLFDSQGNVIGINNAIYSPTAAASGIGFARPRSFEQRGTRRVVDRSCASAPGS
jgi:S1-C subfamily serine protease